MQIYLHIPFCDSKCHYCSFYSLTKQEQKQEAYFKSLLKQLKFDLEHFSVKKHSVNSLYIGGGTPSCANANLYENIFDYLQDFLKEDAEISSEANPNTASYEWLKIMKSFGLNRLSFGVQSFFDDKLKLLGRVHNIKNIYECIENAKKLDFKNISIDLMYSTALDTKKRLKTEIDKAIKIGINHLSAYALTLEQNTPLYSKDVLQKDSVELSKFLFSYIKSFGFHQYEISNFGKACRHNLGYWNYENYLGIGCSAVGFFENFRYYPEKNLDKYIENSLNKTREQLSKNDILTEKIFLGLRSIIGIDKRILPESYLQKANLLKDEKLLKYENGIFYNTDFLLSDELALFLME